MYAHVNFSPPPECMSMNLVQVIVIISSFLLRFLPSPKSAPVLLQCDARFVGHLRLLDGYLDVLVVKSGQPIHANVDVILVGYCRVGAQSPASRHDAGKPDQHFALHFRLTSWMELSPDVVRLCRSCSWISQ